MKNILVLIVSILIVPASFAQTEDLLISATAPLPEQLRDGATVLQRLGGGTSILAREGTNGFTCLSDGPGEGHNVVCMEEDTFNWNNRLRELRREGMSLNNATAQTLREIENGELGKLIAGSLSYYLTGPNENELTHTALINMPYATTESTGLPATPRDIGAWIMCPGVALAHIMIGAQQYGVRIRNVPMLDLCGAAETSN